MPIVCQDDTASKPWPSTRDQGRDMGTSTNHSGLPLTTKNSLHTAHTTAPTHSTSPNPPIKKICPWSINTNEPSLTVSKCQSPNGSQNGSQMVPRWLTMPEELELHVKPAQGHPLQGRREGGISWVQGLG